MRDSHWLIVRQDYEHKASVALPYAYLSKYEAISAMEKYIEETMKNLGGNNCDVTPHDEVKIIYVCKNRISDPNCHTITYIKPTAHEINSYSNYTKLPITMEKIHIDELHPTRNSTKWIPYGYYVTRSPKESMNSYTIWQKIKAEPDGYLFSGADKHIQLIGLSLLEVPNNTYNNLINDDTHTASTDDNMGDQDNQANDDYRDILFKSLVMSPSFAEIGRRFNREARSVADLFKDNAKIEIGQGKLTTEQLAQIPDSFYKSCVDTGATLNLPTLRQTHPSDFSIWKSTGGSQGYWIPRNLLDDEIVFS
jgi:hypothetical protein